MRQVVLDTETTGLEPAMGHRIIEVGCVELVNRRLTGRRFHRYLNPDREVDAGALEVHGLSNAFLRDKPRFVEILDDFLEFVSGAELIIHNAPFDVGFLDHELRLAGNDQGPLERHCRILDTLVLARARRPGQKNSLDALCRAYKIDNSRRELHGALLDAEILADVYLAMTGGQTSLSLETGESQGQEETRSLPRPVRRDRPRLTVVRATPEELLAHELRLDDIQRASGGQCLWRLP